ncbi:MAG: gamma carbonic anhydrase family protein [Meiothermus sp.]|nr:gamma carbonic anhydrase family protein [Meiothermus sp.]
MPVYRLSEHQPKIHDTAFIAPSATVIGQAEIGENASVWFGAIVRSDTERVVIGAGTNVQDGAVLHADPGDPCVLGPGVTVGHRAVVHGATVEEGALIGIGAVVLNKAKVGRGAVVGAGAVVPPGMEIPDGMLAIGIPAKVRGPIVGRENAARYVELSRHYLEQLAPINPVGRYQLTFRGEEALSPFTDTHLQLKRRSPKSVESLKAVADGRSSDLEPETLKDLEREGFIREV